MNALALALVLAQLPPPSGSDSCGQIRAVRQLAQKHSLDDRTVAALELTYCKGPPPAPGTGHLPASSAALAPLPAPSARATLDCIELWTMSTLARAASADAATLAMIDSGVQTACAAGPVRYSWKWPNGRVAKDPDGLWYPDGSAARNRSGWWYLTRNAAKSGADWWYPNGKMAKNGGRWYGPGGNVFASSDALTGEACKAYPSGCGTRLYNLKVTEGDARDAALLELAWSTRKP